MAVDMFLKLAGIDGESKDHAHSKEIQLDSFTFGVRQKGSANTGTGLGAGKAEWSEMTFVKSVDSATPQLIRKCSTGEHIDKAVLAVRRAGADKDYYTITLTELIVSAIENSGGLSGESLLLETVSLHYAKIEFDYKAQDSKGALGGSIKAMYDLKANKGG